MPAAGPPPGPATATGTVTRTDEGAWTRRRAAPFSEPPESGRERAPSLARSTSSQSSSRSTVLGIVTGLAPRRRSCCLGAGPTRSFWLFAAVMISVPLPVVTMKDIIRCGLAIIVCFGSLAGSTSSSALPSSLPRRSSSTSSPSISVLILFAIMLTQDQGRSEPARLRDRRWSRRPCDLPSATSLSRRPSPRRTGRGRRPRPPRHDPPCPRLCSSTRLLPFEIVSAPLAAAARRLGLLSQSVRRGLDRERFRPDAYLVSVRDALCYLVFGLCPGTQSTLAC